MKFCLTSVLAFIACTTIVNGLPLSVTPRSELSRPTFEARDELVVRDEFNVSRSDAELSARGMGGIGDAVEVAVDIGKAIANVIDKAIQNDIDVNFPSSLLFSSLIVPSGA